MVGIVPPMASPSRCWASARASQSLRHVVDVSRAERESRRARQAQIPGQEHELVLLGHPLHRPRIVGRELHETLRDYGTGGEYVNNQTDTDDARVRAAFGENYDRLAAVKAMWDPEDRLQSTQHVAPE